MGLSSGRNGQFKADTSTSAAGTAVTTLEHISTWSSDGTRDKIDVTCMGDGNKVYVDGFRDEKITITGFIDDLTDTMRTVADGVARKWLWCDDTTATTKRWSYGLYSADISRSSGASKAKEFTMTLTAAGSITETFSTSTPSYP